MKTRVLLMSGLFALSMIAAGEVAQAQQIMQVDIPFDFVAGGTTLPAGEYRVARLNGYSDVLVLRDQDDPRASIMIPTFTTEGRQSKSRPTLVFHHYGDQYFLSQVWSAGDVRGRQLMKSAAEKEIAKLAKLETKGEVTVSARLTPAQR
jgi:hypothetical protein